MEEAVVLQWGSRRLVEVDLQLVEALINRVNKVRVIVVGAVSEVCLTTQLLRGDKTLESLEGLAIDSDPCCQQ